MNETEYINTLNTGTITKNSYLLADSYNIKEQDLDEFCDITGGINLILAETGSGKSVLLKHILSKIHKNYDKILMMSMTARLQPFYDFFPREYIIDDYDEKTLIELWNEQVYRKNSGNKLDNILVILDDVIASNSFKKSEMLEHIAFGARHLNITIWLLSQNFTSIKPRIRNNIRVAIAFHMDSQKERQKFIEQFLSTMNTKVGEKIFKNITGTKYQSIIVSKYKTGCPMEDRVKRFIADPNIKINMEKKEKQKQTTDEMYRPNKIKNNEELLMKIPQQERTYRFLE